MSIAATVVDEPVARRRLEPAAPAPALAAASPRSLRPVSHAAQRPTQEGPRGIRFDFNDGCRLLLPEAEHPWRVRLIDLDTDNILFDTECKAGLVNSIKRYYIRFRLEVWQQSERVFAHDYSAADREVLVRFPVDTVGDPLGWFPYAVKFKRRHGCRLTCAMDGRISALLRPSYPDITFVSEQEIDPRRFYATYSIAVFYVGGTVYDHKDFVPCDFRRVGLHRAAGYILGVDPAEEPPHIVIPDDGRPLAAPYVCIAVQSTMQAKYWNNPNGWAEIVGFLKEAGYRVVCIDLKATHGDGLVWNHMPPGAEDQTGDRPLLERARWLKHAEFFIGLSSGLSWLAWAMDTPVVMISGVTHPINEFTTPYRVINYHTCNSCWNDPLAGFDRSDFMSCPRHKGTPRQFECSRSITAEQVKQTIKKIPNFGRLRWGRAAGRPIIVDQFTRAVQFGERLPPREQYVKTLEYTDRLPPRELVRYQQQLLRRLIRYAHAKLPFYRERLDRLFTADGGVDLTRWSTVPLLKRAEIVAHNDEMRVANLPAYYGSISEGETSGSTGVPLKIATNDMVAYASSALLARAARRLGVDPSRPLARIGFFRTEQIPEYPEGAVTRGWSIACPDTPFYQLKLATPVHQQLEWLARRKAPYLLALPSAALNVAYSVTPEQGRALGIEVVILVGETVPDGTRELIAERFGARLICTYGCREVGQIGYECEAGHYHVAAENVMVEILDSEDREVAPGGQGRVIVTGLFNYVMPFIRYELGDVAVAGTGPCSCGRTAPVIKRVVGRTRNMFEFRDGTRLWPRASMIWPMQAFVPYRRYQLIQVDYETIEFRYEPDGSGREPDLAGLNACARQQIHPSVKLYLNAVDSLPIGPSGKLEEFVSRLNNPNTLPQR